MAGGRPIKYKPEFCDLLVEHLKGGYSFESFGAIADVSEETLHQWAKKYPEFSESKKRGWSHCRLWWEQQGNKGLWTVRKEDEDGNTTSETLNSTIWIFNMKNRFGWRDKQDITIDDVGFEFDIEK